MTPRSLALLALLTLAACPAPPKPVRSFGNSMVYDPMRHSIVLVEGTAATEDDRGNKTSVYKTFSWNGADWTELGDPPPRAHMRAVYDAARQRIFGYGGINCADGTCFDNADSSTLDSAPAGGNTWTVTPSAQGPGPRHSAALFYDPMRQGVVLYGGAASFCDCADGACQSTWFFDGQSWTEVAKPAP